jgi:hypothetical protein
MTLVMAWIWSNRQLFAEIIGGLLIVFLCWWFFIHNPKVIKGLENEKAELTRQVANRDAAINMLGSIERAHDVINKTIYRNISSIRYLPKPGRDGNFYGANGMPEAMPVNAATK